MRLALNLRSLDLNLLVALEALIEERQVTRAAQRIGLSQPAMSGALSRLRRILGDPLLIRTRDGMQPTPRALALAAPLAQALRQIERVFEHEGVFNPKASSRCFTLRMSDLLEHLLLPALLDRLGRSAPGIALDIVHLSPERTIEALEANEIDFALSTGLKPLRRALRAEPLMQDRMVCVMRRGHPAAKRRLTLEAFLGLKHMKVSMSPTDSRFVDDVLADMRRRREVRLNVPHWLIVPKVVRGSDLVAVMSERAARSFGEEGLVLRDLPFACPPFTWCLYWHRRTEEDRACSWLRERLREAVQGLGAEKIRAA